MYEKDVPPLRIVFISFHAPPSYSGAGLATFRLARRLQSENISVQILAGRTDPRLAGTEMRDGVPIRRLPFLKTSLPLVRELAFLIACMVWLLRHRDSYDLIQLAFYPLWLPLWLAARIAGKPVFQTMTLYGADDLGSLRRRKLIGPIHLWLCRQSSGIIGVSRRLLEVSAPYVTSPESLKYLPYSVDLDRFFPIATRGERLKLRRELGLPVQDPVVVFSGAVIERKGVGLAVSAWKRVIQEHPKAHLYLIGPVTVGQGPEKYRKSNGAFVTRLRQIVKQSDLQDNVHFLGEQGAQVPAFLRAADLFVLPSKREGLPNAALEALASGLPIILCDYPWVPDDLTAAGRAGLIVAPTPEVLGKTISTLLSDSTRRAQMSRAARQLACRQFDADRLTHELLEWYTERLAAVETA